MSKVRYGLGLTGAALACAIAGVGAPANAQAPASMPPAPFAGAEPIVAFGQDMGAKGIFFQLGRDEQIMALVSGGYKNGTMPAGQTNAGVIFDLETMFGLTGSSFHIAFDQRDGISAVNSISASKVFFQSDSEGLDYNMSQLYWEQGFDNDRLDILVGRTQPTFDFMLWDVSCAAVSSIQCAQMGSFYPSQDSHPFGFSQWGTRVNFQITPEIYVRGGIYNENPVDGNFHSTGFNWNSNGAVGALIPVQVG